MQRFTEEEAQEILRRAAQAPLDEYTSDELQRSAAELGISAEALARAEAEIREERTVVEFERIMKSQVRGEVVKFVGVVLTMAAINLFTNPHHLWFLYVFVFWGLALAGTVYRSRDRHSEAYLKALDRWKQSDGKLSPSAIGEIISKK